MKSNLACPLCRNQGIGDAVPLDNPVMGSGLSCQNGHVFNDTADLMALRPGIIKGMALPKIPRPPAKNVASIQVTVSSVAHKQLTDRFGNSLSETLGSIVTCILEERSYFVGGVDAAKISETVGQQIRSGQQLAGAVYSLKHDRDTFKAQVDAKTVAGSVVVDGRSNGQIKFQNLKLMEFLGKKAIERGETLGETVESVLEYLMDQGHLGSLL
jgi:hypothetical protein